MRWNPGLTYIEKEDAKRQWHPWFAWYPVRTGPRECRWLEWVECKLKGYDHIEHYPIWEYRKEQT